MNSINRNSSFKELYEEAKNSKPAPVLTPARKFIQEVAEVTAKSEPTVVGWLCTGRKPDALSQRVLSEHFNTPIDVLFP